MTDYYIIGHHQLGPSSPLCVSAFPKLVHDPLGASIILASGEFQLEHHIFNAWNTCIGEKYMENNDDVILIKKKTTLSERKVGSQMFTGGKFGLSDASTCKSNPNQNFLLW